MQNRSRTILAICVLLTVTAATAQADWFDGFESYPAGGGVHGLGGWSGWNDDPAFDGVINDLYAFTGSQSLAVSGATDLVQQWSGYSSGVWYLTAWMLIPTDFTGETYFLVLNTYAPNGTQNWSTQVRFSGGVITTDSAGGETMPYVTGQWSEVQLLIDLQSNLQTFYYNGVMLYQASWTEGVSGGGAVNIACVDLYANGASPVFWDEMSLAPATVSVESKSLSQIKDLFR